MTAIPCTLECLPLALAVSGCLLFTASAEAGVTGSTYASTLTRNEVAFTGCTTFQADGSLRASFEPDPNHPAPPQFGLSFEGSFTEIDLFLFGFWSLGPPAPSAIASGGGIHILFGLLMFGSFEVDGDLVGTVSLGINGVLGNCTVPTVPGPADPLPSGVEPAWSPSGTWWCSRDT